MSGMSFSWRLRGDGWAGCVVADDRARAEATASYVSAAPEALLTAVTRLVLGATEVEARFEAEPTGYRWRLRRDGDDVWIQLLRLPDGGWPDDAGVEIWSSRQTVETLGRAIIRGFDEVARCYGERGYHRAWHSPFPRDELERLRTAWRTHRASGHG